MAGEPREFGPYELIRRLGVGGTAETFEAIRAESSGFEQRVCLKRMLPAFSDDRDFAARFRSEARLAAQLRHTHVVGVIDFGEVDGVPYMALELVDGVDLRSLLRSCPGRKIPPEMAALIGFDVARALEHAHQTLVHRDVSTSNVLVSRAGEAKLADFGLAKAMDGAMVTASRSTRGTIPYMAPEQMRGDRIDARADLFSLGVVMFECVAGVRPFDGAHDVETMHRVLEGDRLCLIDVAPDTPAPLREAIERLLEVEPDDRTANAAQLVEELAPMASAPGTRRRLADMVEGHRGGPLARVHVRARDDERDTELSKPPASLPLSASEKPETTDWRKTWGVIGAAIALVAMGLGARSFFPSVADEAPEPSSSAAAVVKLPSPEASSAPSAATAPASPAPAVATASSTTTGVEAQTAAATTQPAATKSAAASTPARVSRGWLHVIVQPWGNVWIDGVWMGRAPVKARLPRGRHVVKVGRELPSQTRVVRLEAGARRELEIQLVE